MRVYISADMEGIGGIVSAVQCHPREKEYEIARRLMTLEVLAAVHGAKKAGATRIVVNDAHDGMRNFIIEEFPEYVEVVSGFPKPLCMMSGISSDFDVAFLIGYHSRKGVKASILDHTMSGTLIQRVIVNGEEVSELWLSAAVAGHYNVPIGLVTGDDKLISHAKEILGDVEAVTTKIALSRVSAVGKSPIRIRREVEEAAMRAVKRAREGSLRPFKPSPPFSLELEFTESLVADLAEAIPGVERVDGLRIRYKTDNILKLYRIVELCLLLGIAAQRLH
ncbi:MAG: peptidase M55 [Thermoprotei archaeon]|nr:MAG: peptidase M55 [Thermoprotei archaeon]